MHKSTNVRIKRNSQVLSYRLNPSDTRNANKLQRQQTFGVCTANIDFIFMVSSDNMWCVLVVLPLTHKNPFFVFVNE